MPELPEVETIRQDLSCLIVGRKVLAIATDTPGKILPSLELVKKAVVGSTIKRIDRRAKLLQLILDNGKVIAFHLKMSGRLLVRKVGEEKDDWQHIVITLSEGLELRFADMRKFGWMKLFLSREDLKKVLTEYGPEPLSDLTLKKFREILEANGRAIKIVLMDQEKIAGIGNIYANEALFLAKIDPRTPADKIKEKQAAALFLAIEKVLRLGLRYRGASDRYYLDALGQKGHFQEHFLVYGRQGKECGSCKGMIKRIALGGRGTFYCPSCQK